MKQLLAVSFIVLFYGVIAQTRPPLDTAVPIVRVSPSLRNNGSSASDSFGFAIVFYQLDPVVSTNISQWRIVVGAPNGTYPGGLNLNNANCAPPSSTPFANSGLVYLCSIQPGQDTCGGAVGDGSASNGRLFDCYTQSAIPQSSLTPFQQMGASLYSYGGYLVACAPAWSSGSVTSPSHKGACYVSFNNSLRFFSQMLPCEGSQHPSSYFFDHNYCYSGLSLAVKGKTAIFGDPLAFTTGMASYIQLDTTPALFSTIVSKGSDVTAGGIVYGSTSMNINGSIVYRTNTLKGYSVGIGHITRQNVYDYLVAIPRWNVSSYVGSVEVFAFPNSGAPLSGQNPPLGSSANTFFSNSIGVYDSLMNVTAYGTQSGEQFGASMDTADLNQDGYDELIVGAPFYTDYTTTPNFMYEAGRVYVFNNTQGGLSSTPIILTSTTPSVGGRFGHVILSVGDINGDGTEDFAVSAPFEPCTSSDGNVSTGSVYLYTGSRTTLVSPAPVQKITACDVRQASYSYLNGTIIQSFGYSLASKADLDGNTYNDLAVGAFQSRMVFLLRTFSVANVTVTMTNIGGGISLTTPGCNSSYPCGTVMLCATYSCSSKSGSCSSNLNMNFTVQEMTGRAFFTIPSGMGTAPPTSTPTYVVIPATMQVMNCTNITFYSKLAPADLVSPLQFQATVQDLSRNLVSDSTTSLADFRAIPILMGGTSSVYVSIVRRCAVPNACMSDLSLMLGAVSYTRSLTVKKTLIAISLTVNNTGDDVGGINLMVTEVPTFVTAVMFVKASGLLISCSNVIDATVYMCSNIVDGFLTQYSSVSKQLIIIASNAHIASNLTLNVTSQDKETNVLNNVVVFELLPQGQPMQGQSMQGQPMQGQSMQNTTQGFATACNNLLICGDCIRTAGCVWCNSTGYTGSRCFPRNATSASGCSSIMDPRSSPTSTYTQMPTDSIFSTTPSISLRAGDPLTINISVVSLPNTPLDLYILMDLSDSMGGPLASVKNVSQAIAQQVSSITTNVRIGFGSFNEKPIQPFSQFTPAACISGQEVLCAVLTQGKEELIQYSFFHRVNFTSNFSLPNVQITTNFDLPESSFDALAQVLACDQQLGWRSRSAEGPDRGLQRLVLFITDDQPHLAGDGRLAGIYQAYDGKCHLKPYSSSANYIPSVVGEQIYNEDSLLYDYPSVGIIANLLNTYQVIPIFAIVPLTTGSTHLDAYVGMQDLFNSIGVKAFARPVLSGATNLLSVINTVYQEVVQTIALTLPTESDMTISLSQVSCPSNSTTVGQTCTNVGLNQIAQFSVTLTLKDCSSPSPSSLTFSVPGFGLTTIFVNKICGCMCDSVVNVSSSVCSYQGNLTCGGCLCVPARTGAFCQISPCNQTCINGGTCQIATGLCSCPPIPTNQSTAPMFYNDSTHGILLPPDVPSYAGPDCSCTNYNNCPLNNKTNYICSGRGKCACGACKCAATPYTWTWQGTACDCPANPSDCFDTTFSTGALCGGQGTCSCDSSGKGMCVCNSGYTGTYCGTKIQIPSCSDTIGNCALNPASCNSMYTINSTSSVSSGTQPCYITSGLCTFKYVILPNSHLQIDKQNPSCQFEAWKIALILIGSILALFVLILIIVKIILVILDYVEVKRWEKELKEADFSKNQNPLYQSPEMQYTNVAYGKAM